MQQGQYVAPVGRAAQAEARRARSEVYSGSGQDARTPHANASALLYPSVRLPLHASPRFLSTLISRLS